jgi:hypothetical protein
VKTRPNIVAVAVWWVGLPLLLRIREVNGSALGP